MSSRNDTLVLDAWYMLPWAKMGEEQYIHPRDATTHTPTSARFYRAT